jgi:hypothetical protein
VIVLECSCIPQGAFWALMLALLTGVVRMVLVFVYHYTGGCGVEDTRPDILTKFHYMYFSLLITVMTAVTAIVISLLTEKPDPVLVRNYTITRT